MRAWQRNLLLSVALAVEARAALVSSTLEVRPDTGADSNGGGFAVSGAGCSPLGTDWTQQDTPKYALTNGTANGTTTILTASASADMACNVAYITKAGTITTGYYQIMSAVPGTSIAVDRSTGLAAATGAVGNVDVIGYTGTRSSGSVSPQFTFGIGTGASAIIGTFK